jgi:hypothetical protein
VNAALPLHADIGIGGTPIRLHTDSREFIDLLGERYAGFMAPANAVEHHFELTLQPPDDSSEDEDVTVVRSGPAWRISRGDFRAEWNPATRRGWIRQTPSPYSLDSVLRIVHTLILAPRGGVLMHASSAIRNGRAFVFAGVSGAGKTTISRLAPADAHLLTDEMSYLRRDGEAYSAHGTPFSGELGRPGENLSAPLAAIYLLRQGPENRIDDVAPADALRGLLANVLFFAKDPALVKAVFAAAADLAERVPVKRLTFLPDARVWDLIGTESA